MLSTIACVGCKKESPQSDTQGAPQTSKVPSRIEAVAVTAFGEQPGFLADGAVVVAMRAGATQDFLHHLPLPSEAARELAKARRELGFDPFTDDVLARFSVPPDAVISMTLGRPLGLDARKAVTRAIHPRDDRFLGLVSRVMQEASDGVVPAEKPLPAEETLIERPPPSPPPHGEVPEIGLVEPIDEPIVDPLLPAISPGDRREIDTLLSQADAMGVQLRVHIPSEDPDKIFGELRTRVPAQARAEGDQLCRGLAAEVCVAGNRALLIVRREGAAAVLDLVLFTSRSDAPDLAARRGAAAEAINAPRATLPVLANMSGHASAYVDAGALVEVVAHERVGRALRDLLWDEVHPAQSVKHNLDATEELRRLLDAPRLFDGLLANVHHDADRTQLQITWPLREGQEAVARRTLSPPPLVVPVPSLAALCDGALVCARSRGLPAPKEVGSQLAMGVYGNARVLEDTLDHADEEAAFMVLLSATWPNALGTVLWQLPLAEARGPEAAMVRGFLDAISRIGGMGLSVRNISVGRRSVTADYAVYARVPVNDLSLVGTLLTMAEMRLTPTTLDGVEGKVSMLRIPEDDVPAILMTREDPETVKDDEGKESRYGWLTLVDDPARLQWLLAAPTDEGQEPLLYGEIPNLWKLVASVPEAVDELGFARTWATDRRFAAALRLDDGQPHLLLELSKR